jgi:Fe-Mn family superoxide dismutase
VEIHHSKHHNAYTTNLNAAIAGTDMEGKTIENILINLDMKKCLFVTMAVVLQSLFWTVMTQTVADYQLEIYWLQLRLLWNFEEFKASFSKAGATQFGSGWAWLCVQKGGKVEVVVLKPRQSINARCRLW